jgi:hypothetical protein
LPAREGIGHWSRAFAPRNHTRTVVTGVTTNGKRVTLQLPGDARDLPQGPWLAIGLVNRDPKAFLGAEIEMIEVLALWLLDPFGVPAARSQAVFSHSAPPPVRSPPARKPMRPRRGALPNPLSASQWHGSRFIGSALHNGCLCC